VQVDPAGQLAHFRARADLIVGIDRWDPALLGLGEDRLADMGLERRDHREPDTLLAQVPDQPGAGPGAIRAHQHRLLVAAGGQLRQGEVDQLDQVIAGAGRGVARPQQARQRLARGSPAVQVGQ
jgi:hypothetical protein